MFMDVVVSDCFGELKELEEEKWESVGGTF